MIARLRGLAAGCVGFVLVLFVFSPDLRAAEGGEPAYAPGSFASFMDALPAKPGFAVFNYFVYYNGNADASRQIPIAGQIGAGVEATTYANSFGGFFITPLKLLGGYYAVGVSIPIVWNTVSAEVTLPAGGTAQRSDDANGLGDIEFWPIAMSWAALANNLHVTALGGIYAPTGGFQNNRLANQGLGYWTFEPGVIVSYFNQKNGIEGTSYVGYDFNTTNSDTDYKSGQVFHVDGTAAWHFLPVGKGAFGAGATGFYLQQTTSDSGSGARLGGFKTMSAGLGPVISYGAQYSKLGFAVSVKWLPQIGVSNTVKGDYFWIKLGVTF
jgi:hypothetical protein